MPLDVYLSSDFEHVHERDQFSRLAELFRDKLGNLKSPHCLIGNALIYGAEIDAIYINKDYFHVIELKSHGGVIQFSENGPWLADGQEVKGGNQMNPFKQIRRNRFKLMDYLKDHAGDIFIDEGSAPRNIIQAKVLFAQNIDLEVNLPRGIREWLTISDQSEVLNSLAALRNTHFTISDNLISGFVGVLGLSEEQKYRPGEVGNVPRAIGQQPASNRVSLFFYKDFRFDESLGKCLSRGAAAHESALEAKKILVSANKGVDQFPKDKSRVNVEEAVRGAFRYKIRGHYQLLIFRHENVVCPLCFGRKEDLDNWLLEHDGLTITVSTQGKFIVTNIGGEDVVPEPVMAKTGNDEPIFSKVPELELSKYLSQSLVLKALNKLSLRSESEDVEEVFGNIQDHSVKALLVDVYNLAVDGKIEEAQARLSLFEGDSVPVSDVSGQFIQDKLGEEINTDRVVDGASLKSHELNRLLAGKFEDWMLYPHPDQKRYIDSDYDGPTILNGISGSGKTCILVHRAKRLAERYPKEKIGIVTLNRDLVVLIRNLVNKLCGEAMARRIEVRPFYNIFRDLAHRMNLKTYVKQLCNRSYHPERRNLETALKSVDFKAVVRDFDKVSKETAENTWDLFFDHPADSNKAYIDEAERVLMSKWDGLDRSRYMREECDLIRSALTLSERSGYLEGFKRTGRTISLEPDERKKILEVLALYEEWMIVGAVLDVQELTQITNAVWKGFKKLSPRLREPYRCLLIDEYQDFSTLDLRVLGFIAPTKKENGFFLTGDRVQKIQVKHLDLNAANLNVDPLRLRKNFRNSRQILKAASVLAKKYSTQASKSGEEIDYIDPELAVRDTLPPQVIKTDNALAKVWEIALDTIDAGADDWSVCIATCNTDEISVERILQTAPRSLTAQKISGNCINAPERVVITDLQGLKGFEFKHVIVLGCGSGQFPAQGVHPDEKWRDALRLYVALTRARDQVHLIHEGEPSEFIHAMDGFVDKQEAVAKLELTEARPKVIVLSTAQVSTLLSYYNQVIKSDKVQGQAEEWLLEPESIIGINVSDLKRRTGAGAKQVEKLRKQLMQCQKEGELPALKIQTGNKSGSRRGKKRGALAQVDYTQSRKFSGKTRKSSKKGGKGRKKRSSVRTVRG